MSAAGPRAKIFCRLEVDPQTKLTRAIARILRRRCGRQRAKGRRIVNLRRWRREVRVVEYVRERRLKAHMHRLSYCEYLRNTQRHRSRTWPLQHAHARIPESACANRCRRKRREIEVARA